MRLTKYQATFS